jgi:excinuclease ABC subunit A
MVELLFLPSVYAPCTVCNGTRYNAETLEITYHEKNIAQVLGMTVNEAAGFFEKEDRVSRTLKVLQEVGLGYLRLGQSATELSGGEAQRIKLAKELQRLSRGNTLYILDEPTTGLHPTDIEKLQLQLAKLVDAGNTVIVVEHDMQVVAGSDWIIDIGPGAGEEGGKVVAAGTPEKVAKNKQSKTAIYLTRTLNGHH